MSKKKPDFTVINNPGKLLDEFQEFNKPYYTFPSDTIFPAANTELRMTQYRDKWVKLICSVKRTESLIINHNYTAFVAAQSNLLEFVTPKNANGVGGKINIGDANSFYWLFTRACPSSIRRLEQHGYDMKDVVSLQEAVCAIYRRNAHDPSKLFYQYLRDMNGLFVLNDCFNCNLANRQECCKLYLPQLDRRSKLAQPLKSWKLGKYKIDKYVGKLTIEKIKK